MTRRYVVKDNIKCRLYRDDSISELLTKIASTIETEFKPFTKDSIIVFDNDKEIGIFWDLVIDYTVDSNDDVGWIGALYYYDGHIKE